MKQDPIQMPSPQSVAPTAVRLGKELDIYVNQLAIANRSLVSLQVSFNDTVEELNSLRNAALTDEDRSLILALLEGRTDPDSSVIRAKLTRK